MAASQALPLPTTTVSILEFGRWLDGVVVEANAATGEFLVEFDDEAEVPAWVSVGQPWKTIGASALAVASEEEAAAAAAHEEQPALPPLYVPVAADEKPHVEPTVVAAQENNHAPPTTAVSEPPQSDDEARWGELVLDQFAALHAATLRTDGYGDGESAAATRERFERLHRRVEVEAG